jgi:thiosulfate dehydrogenase (quinone) large subunit
MSKKQAFHQRNSSPLNWSAETYAFLSLRLFLALRFIVAGLGKFQNAEGDYAFSNLYGGFVAHQIETFGTKTNLPAFLHSPYLHCLAYVEIILGFALLLGVKTKRMLAITALTYVSLGYGMMMLGNQATINGIGVHLLITAAALYFVRHNKFELLR